MQVSEQQTETIISNPQEIGLYVREFFELQADVRELLTQIKIDRLSKEGGVRTALSLQERIYRFEGEVRQRENEVHKMCFETLRLDMDSVTRLLITHGCRVMDALVDGLMARIETQSEDFLEPTAQLHIVLIGITEKLSYRGRL